MIRQHNFWGTTSYPCNCNVIDWLVVTGTWPLFFPCVGNHHPNWLTNICQRGWNHQPVELLAIAAIEPLLLTPPERVLTPKALHNVGPPSYNLVITTMNPSEFVVINQLNASERGPHIAGAFKPRRIANGPELLRMGWPDKGWALDFKVAEISIQIHMQQPPKKI